MPTVELPEVTPAVYAAVEARAAARSMTIEEYVRELIRRDLADDRDGAIEGLDTVGTIHALREERTDELMRRVSRPSDDSSGFTPADGQ